MKYKFIFFLVLNTSYLIGQNKNRFNDYILVDVKIKNNNYKFIFDTGASTSVFFDVENKLMINSKRLFLAEDSNKKIDTMYYPKEDIDFSLPKFRINIKGNDGLVISKNIPKEFKDSKVYGILGNNLISKFDWLFECTKNKLTICKNKNDIDSLDYENIRIDNQNRIKGRLITDKGCLYNDLYFVDTGFYGIISHTDDDCYNDYINNIKKSISIFDNQVTTERIIKANYEIGNCRIEGIPVNLLKNNSSNLLGIKFFQSFDEVYFLFSENKLLLRKKKEYTFKLVSPFVFNRKIYGYLETPINSSLQFKKWNLDIDASNLKESDFESIEYLVKFTDN